MELEIEREGDELHIRPVRRSLSGVLTKFAKFSPGFMSEGRGEQAQVERDYCDARCPAITGWKVCSKRIEAVQDYKEQGRNGRRSNRL